MLRFWKGDSILSSEIKEIRDHLSTYLKQQGVNIITNSEIKKVNAKTLEMMEKDGPKNTIRDITLRQDDNLMFM